MAEARNLEIVRQVYAALEADQIDALLALCAPDVEWRYPAPGLLSYGGAWRGHDGTLDFLAAHDEAEEILSLETTDMIASGERVFASERGRSPAPLHGERYRPGVDRNTAAGTIGRS